MSMPGYGYGGPPPEKSAPIPTPVDEEAYEPRADWELLYDPVEDAKIVEWRESVFVSLGIDALRARAMAIRKDVCRVKVAEMLENGATAEQAALILL